MYLRVYVVAFYFGFHVQDSNTVGIAIIDAIKNMQLNINKNTRLRRHKREKCLGTNLKIKVPQNI